MTALKALYVFLIAAAVLAFAYVLTLFSPGGAVEDPSGAPLASEGSGYREEAEELYRQFTEKLALGPPTEEDMARMKRALELMDAYLAGMGISDRSAFYRQSQMRATYQNIVGRPDYDAVKKLAAAADEAFKGKDQMKALELYTKLRDLQSKINSEYPESQYYDVNLLAKAEQMMRVVSVVPLAQKVAELERKIAEANGMKRWNEAEKLIIEAMEIQSTINKDYANTSYLDFSKMRHFEEELGFLKAAPIEAALEEALKKAGELEKKGEYVAAAEQYSVAIDRQRDLNTLFDKSRYASDEKLRAFNALKETAMSRKLFSDISSGKEKLDGMLRSSAPVSQIMPLAEDLLIKCERFRSEYPQSSILEEDVVLSLRFINYLGNKVGEISKLAMSNLVPLDREGRAKMLSHEVSQELYGLVMQENPSRNAGAKNPVETVSWENASDFCRRLTWILARPVTLPTRGQFVGAIGSLKYADFNAISWNAGNSGLKTHPVMTSEPNARGFYDLLGNVSEYTAADPKSGKPGIIGGSSQTWTDALTEIPYAEIERSQRGDRMIGFRYVVSKAD